MTDRKLLSLLLKYEPAEIEDALLVIKKIIKNQPPEPKKLILEIIVKLSNAKKNQQNKAVLTEKIYSLALKKGISQSQAHAVLIFYERTGIIYHPTLNQTKLVVDAKGV